MMKISFLLFFILFSSFGIADSTIENTILEKISERHPSDTREWWKSLGPSASDTIIGLYASQKDLYTKMRLIQGLAWFHDSNAVEFIKKNTESSQKDVIRIAAIKSLGISQGAAELSTFETLLTDSDPDIRVATGEALKRIQDPKAKALLESQIKKENGSWISEKLAEPPVDISSKKHSRSFDRSIKTAKEVKLPQKWVGFYLTSTNEKTNAENATFSFESSNVLKNETNAELLIKSTTPKKLVLNKIKFFQNNASLKLSSDNPLKIKTAEINLKRIDPTNQNSNPIRIYVEFNQGESFFWGTPSN